MSVYVCLGVLQKGCFRRGVFSRLAMVKLSDVWTEVSGFNNQRRRVGRIHAYIHANTYTRLYEHTRSACARKNCAHTCLRVRVHVYLCLRGHVFTCVFACVYARSLRVFTCVYACLRAHTCASVRVHSRTRVYTPLRTHACGFTRLCVHLLIYIYIYMYRKTGY